MSRGKIIGITGAVLVLVLALGETGFLKAAAAETGELENFIRARIEIGESMGQFMRERGGFGGSVEEMRQMENEINAMVARILESYGLTIEAYRERSPKVFEDEEAVQAFLERHPDLKRRYEVLPLHQAGPRRGMPH